MKKIRNLCLLLLLGLSLFILSGCIQKFDHTIGILQFVTHPALDLAKEGFIEELEKAGFKDGENIEIIVRNPETKEEDMSAMATDLVRNCDLVLGIATPAAVALKAAAEAEDVDLPILFTAVTDPVDAKLVASNENPGGNVTGTSDMNPVNEQIALVKELLPDIENLGIIHTVSEENSKIQAELAQAKAEELGITTLLNTVTNALDISAAVNDLISDGAEAIYVPTDNNLATNLTILTQITTDAKIPVICGEESQVTNGGTITLSISYKKLGVQTGAMAVQILKDGVQPSAIPVGRQGLTECVLAVNQEVLDAIGLTLPQSIQDRLQGND